jgi:hypothetical protein
MLVLTAFFAASPLDTRTGNFKSPALLNRYLNGSMYLQFTPRANRVGQPVRRVIPPRNMDPRRWFDRTQGIVAFDGNIGSNLRPLLFGTTNQGAKMDRMLSSRPKLPLDELEDMFLERVWQFSHGVHINQFDERRDP